MAMKPVKQNTFFKKKQYKLFKIMTISYKIIQIISGLDFGFFNYPALKAKIFFKSLSLVTSVTLIIIVCLNLDYDTEVWIRNGYFVSLAKYFTYVILLSLTSTKFRTFHDDLHSIDRKFEINSASFKIEQKILCMSFFCFAFRIIVCLAYWTVVQNLRTMFVNIFHICILIAIDVLFVSHAFIFYMVESRLKKLTSMLEKAQTNFSSLQRTYKIYVDVVCKYKRVFDPVLLLALSFNIPEVMSTIYFSVKQLMLGDKEVFIMNIEYIMAVEAIVMTIAPAICAANLSSQADKIKILLHDKLLENMDENKKPEIEQFIRYIEARGCRFRVWKVIPLDADLLGMVLSFCITYLIVIIQFTHVA